MAIRQYIGARYVPRFLGNYSITTIYDALDVVDDGLGTSYIAKKTVPAGTPLTDREFWALYGSSSGAIINLQNQIDTLDGEVDVIKNKIADPVVMMISDSYCVYTDSAGKRINEVFTDLTGIPCDVLYQSGAGFNNGVFDTLINGFSGDPTIYNTIVFVCGANDELATETDVITGMANTAALIRAKFTNVKNIYVMGCGLWFKYGDGHTTITRRSIPAKYKLGCIQNNFGYITNSEYIMRNTDMLNADHLHPSPTGIHEIAKKLAEFFRSGGFNVDYELYVSLTPTGSTTPITKYNMIRHNDTVQLVYREGWGYNQYLPAEIPLNNTLTQLGVVDKSLICNDNSAGFRFSCDARGLYAAPAGSNVTTYEWVGALFLYNEEIHLSCHGFGTAATGTGARFYVTPVVLTFKD